jgi:hypothetical protein
MPRVHDELTQVLVCPESLISFDLPQWDIVIRKAKRAGLLARIECLLADRDLLASVPKQPRMHLESARIVAQNEQRIMRWEISRIQRALASVDTPIIFLKGAAYLSAGLGNAKGRLSSDIDILVSKNMLPQVENALIEHGWVHVKLEDYDQLYYRTWAHELPPLRHRDRNTVIDVHHTILPLTSRLHPDPNKLLEAAEPLLDHKHRILAPTDLLLHSAAHMFQDGDLRQALRELVDIDELTHHFSHQADFWDQLFERAVELDLSRPLYYALRYSHKYLSTQIPETALQQSQKWAPLWPALNFMDQLVRLIIEPAVGGSETRRRKLARLILFARANWLRMPPWLLARHFTHKIIKGCGWTKTAVESE